MVNNTKRIEVTDTETGEIFGLNAEMLVNDVRSTLLTKRRAQITSTTWGMLSEDAQKKEIEDATNLAEDLVAAVVDLVAAGGHDVIHAKLDNFKVKDGAITLTAKGAADDGALLSLNYVGHKNLKIVVTNVEEFDQQRDKVKPQKDQPSLLPEVEDDGISDAEIEEAASDMDDAMDQIEESDSDDDMQDGVDLGEPEDEAPEEEPSKELQAGWDSRMGGYAQERNPFNEDDPQKMNDWDDGWRQADDVGDAPDVDHALGAETSEVEEVEEVEADLSADPDLGGLSPAEHAQAACLSSKPIDDVPFASGHPSYYEWVEAYNAASVEVEAIRQEGRDAKAKGFAKTKSGWKKGTDGERLWLEGWNEKSD